MITADAFYASVAVEKYINTPKKLALKKQTDDKMHVLIMVDDQSVDTTEGDGRSAAGECD